MPTEVAVKDFAQIDWNSEVEADCRRLVEIAAEEDVRGGFDLTSQALVPEAAMGRAAVVARRAGIIAGMPAARMALGQIAPDCKWREVVTDGTTVAPGQVVAEIEGPARGLMTAERVMLNLLGRLSGVATLTRQYVAAVAGTRARIYDTRKTTPGWRTLEKYAVRQGGGYNHRLRLSDAILIKDNHLALRATVAGAEQYSPAEAVARAREFLAARRMPGTIVEIEVDTLEQLESVLGAGPDIVLLDNMTPQQLTEALAMRDAADPQIQLEASGGVNLSTVPAIAASGVDRISVGALTHGAIWLDIALDWQS